MSEEGKRHFQHGGGAYLRFRGLSDAQVKSVPFSTGALHLLAGRQKTISHGGMRTKIHLRTAISKYMKISRNIFLAISFIFLMLAGLLQIFAGAMVIPINFLDQENDMGSYNCVKWHEDTVTTAKLWLVGTGLVVFIFSSGALATIGIRELRSKVNISTIKLVRIFLGLSLLTGLLQIFAGSWVIPFNFDDSESDMGPIECVNWHEKTVITAEKWMGRTGLLVVVLSSSALALISGTRFERPSEVGSYRDPEPRRR